MSGIRSIVSGNKIKRPRWRTRLAYRLAVTEHNVSRILFLFLLVTLGVAYYRDLEETRIFLVADIVLWVIYWISHTLEKKAFGRYARF